jgi:tetratricopeptide (TPR) repeat protein
MSAMEKTAAREHEAPAQPAYLGDTGRIETEEALVAAERLLDSNAYGEVVAALGEVRVPSSAAPDLALRVLHTESWARLYLGELEHAATLAERARELVEGPAFTDTERAESLFRLGACRLRLGKVANAVCLFSEAVRVAKDAGPDAERVLARAFEWRARCYVIQRDWEAAQADADRSLEHAQQLQDVKLLALTKMQQSIIAERRGEPALAREHAERARALAHQCGDRQIEARLLNNLGGLAFLVGEPEVAVARIKEAFALSLEIGAEADAAQAVSSLAQVHLRCGAPQLAEEQARYALEILAERADFLDERGNVRLVLGRALLAQGRVEEAETELATAERLFTELGSTSHVAATWMARGDVQSRKGDSTGAAVLYRRAAEALQDFHF